MKDLLSSSLTSQTRIKNERMKYLSNPDHPLRGIRNVIRDSWSRSVSFGIDPHNTSVPVTVPSHSKNDYLLETLQRYADSYLLSELRDLAEESQHLLMLADAYGTIRTIEGREELKQVAAETLTCIVGAEWSEEKVGTNALGTALATGKVVQVIGEEHFTSKAQNWTCAAAPIRHPRTGTILGAVDMTGLLKDFHPHSIMTVIAVSKAIETLLEKRIESERFLILERFTDLLAANHSRTVLAIDSNQQIVKASQSAYDLGMVDYGKKYFQVPTNVNQETEWTSQRGNGTWVFRYIPCLVNGDLVGALIIGESKDQRQLMHATNHASKSRKPRYTFDHIIGKSISLQHAKDTAVHFADSDWPVLLYGETGTGKELFAQSIHNRSRRKDERFVAINCSTMTRELAASELFGYTPGAFTGASKSGNNGKFVQAHNGTLFLDEIADLPLHVQPMLLRALEEKEISPIGSQKDMYVNVRVIAASNKHLWQAVKEGSFREDLYFRLSLLTLDIPPLRERSGDIEILFNHFLHVAAREMHLQPPMISPSTWQTLLNNQWHGNVRQLRNVAYRLVSLNQPVIEKHHLPKEIVYLEQSDSLLQSLNSANTAGSRFPNLNTTEMSHILNALHQCNQNVSKAAKLLGISRSTIYRKLQQK